MPAAIVLASEDPELLDLLSTLLAAGEDDARIEAVLTAHGNELSEDDQWRKLARAVEIAGDVWGYGAP